MFSLPLFTNSSYTLKIEWAVGTILYAPLLRPESAAFVCPYWPRGCRTRVRRHILLLRRCTGSTVRIDRSPAVNKLILIAFLFSYLWAVVSLQLYILLKDERDSLGEGLILGKKWPIGDNSILRIYPGDQRTCETIQLIQIEGLKW